MEIQKERVRELINNWNSTDDLFFLADALILIEEVLRIEEFPMIDYKIWIRK